MKKNKAFEIWFKEAAGKSTSDLKLIKKELRKAFEAGQRA